jgi:integrase
MAGAGNITRRGERSWRLKFEGGERDPINGKRRTRYVTVRGTKKEAQRELTRRLAEVDKGTAVDPSTVTIAEYLRGWLDSASNLAPKTLERYRQLAEQQIIPHLGGTLLQKLRPAQIHSWHSALLKCGGKDGRPLSARTVGHAHRILHGALERAMRLEIVSRNVAHVISPPKVDAAEIVILTAEEITDVLDKLGDHPLHPIVALAVSTGIRRGELCALPWGAVDFDAATIRVERSLEETASGLRIKPPKTRHGFRTIAVPKSTAEILREHYRQQLERRVSLGLGRPGPTDFVFTLADGSTYPPDKLSRDWGNVVRDRKLPQVMFHALRHSHASALISAGVDIVTVSRRLGHGSPSITLRVYAHAFGGDKDAAAARAMDATMCAKSPA